MISHTPASESSLASASLCSSLAMGIHAAAQPLTVLLAGLSKGHSERMNTDELRELIASSALEVQRACTLFSCLQQLVMAESSKPLLSSTPILPLLAYVTEGVNLLFEQNGIGLSLVLPDACPNVLIHCGQTTQALSRVLLAVHGLSAAQDMVELTASSSADGVHIVVQNRRLSPAVINPEASLSMAVAEANMRSQQAGFSLRLQPLSVRIELPQAPFAY